MTTTELADIISIFCLSYGDIPWLYGTATFPFILEGIYADFKRITLIPRERKRRTIIIYSRESWGTL